MPANISIEQLAALGRIDSPTVANAVEAFGVRPATEGYASLELRCLFGDLPPSVGYAFTCAADSTSPARRSPSQDEAFYRALEAAPKPAIVVMHDVGPQRLRSCHAGDVMSSLFQRLGAIALVTDGGVRDLAGVRQRAPGFQMFAAGVVVAHGLPTIVEIGVPVSIFGLAITSGDLLHGDGNGLLTVPLAIAGQLAARAEQVWRSEKELVDFVQSPAFSLDAMGQNYGW
jgi:4-hydroxy-4-methyl-2-oxoglutarate aldolase